MTFISATQATDLDRTDNIRNVSDAARRYREAGIVSPDVPTDVLVGIAQTDSATAEFARVELIARFEPRLRALITENRAVAATTDLHQAAMLGVLEALAIYTPKSDAQFFTVAYYKVRAALADANREASPDAAERSTHGRYFAAMRAADGDAVVARRWSMLQRLSIAELESIADGGNGSTNDAFLAREIIDHRVDVYERHAARGYIGTGRGQGQRRPVPAWEEYREQSGRGLDGATFDAIHASVTYLEDAVGSGVTRLDAGADTEDSDDGATGHDVTADPNAVDPFELITERLSLHELMTTLDARELEIMERHLAGQTDREIADGLELSRPRVVNIRKGIIARFRKLAQG